MDLLEENLYSKNKALDNLDPPNNALEFNASNILARTLRPLPY